MKKLEWILQMQKKKKKETSTSDIFQQFSIEIVSLFSAGSHQLMVV